jgi:tetratricopeptide (TPR) repeat protein
MSNRPPRLSEPANSGSRAIESALFALRMQRPDEAERLAAAVLNSDRRNTLAARVLGRALLMQGRAAEAIVPLERAARRGDDPAIETELAIALAAAGRRDEALDQLRQTTARRPPFPQAFVEHGGLLSKIGSLEEAVAVLESGLTLAPDVVELQIELGFVYLKRNDRAKARGMFSKVLERSPERADVLPALARVMAFDGEYAAAADLFRRALGLRPDDAMTRNNLGACLLEMGEREAGEASLRAAVRNAPQMAGLAIMSLAAASHGRFFLRPSAVAKFLRGEKT